MGYHDVAQVCLNGHMVNDSSRRNPEFNKKHCDQCGAETITSCPECNEPIQGDYHVDNVIALGFGPFPPKSFCHNCGRAYPWTRASLEAAKEFADMIDGLSDEDRDKLKQSLNDLVADTPRTAVAATRWKLHLSKAGQVVADGFKEVMYSIAVEAAKKGIWGG